MPKITERTPRGRAVVRAQEIARQFSELPAAPGVGEDLDRLGHLLIAAIEAAAEECRAPRGRK